MMAIGAVEELWLCVGSLPGMCSSAHSLEAALAPYDSDVQGDGWS